MFLIGRRLFGGWSGFLCGLAVELDRLFRGRRGGMRVTRRATGLLLARLRLVRLEYSLTPHRRDTSCGGWNWERSWVWHFYPSITPCSSHWAPAWWC